VIISQDLEKSKAVRGILTVSNENNLEEAQNGRIENSDR